MCAVDLLHSTILGKFEHITGRNQGTLRHTVEMYHASTITAFTHLHTYMTFKPCQQFPLT